MKRPALLLLLVTVLVATLSTPAQGAFGWGAWRDRWIQEHPFRYPTPEVAEGSLSTGLEWPAFVRAYKRHVHKAWVAWAAQPEPSPERVSTGPTAPAGGIQGLICSVFGSHCSAALHVADCESGFNPFAQNPSGAAGLFQIMPFWWDGANPFDPVWNTYKAFEISHGGTNWTPWAVACRP